MVKVVKQFTGVYGKATLMNFIGKHLCRSLYFNKVWHLQAKGRLLHNTDVFLWILPNISKHFFLQNTCGWMLVLNTPFLFVMSTSATKNVSFNLGYFKYFWDIFFKELFTSNSQRLPWDACKQPVVEVLYRQSAVTRLIYC